MSNSYKEQLALEYRNAMNRICKWRTVFTGWQLGTRVKGDPEADAVRDLRELVILLRVEVSAMHQCLLNSRIISVQSFQKQVIEECKHLELGYQKRFPGFESTDDGMKIDIELAKETTKGWPK